MEEIKKYKGSIPMAGGLYPASGGEYPLINTALIEKDSVSGQRLDKYLEEYPYPFIYVGTAANKEMLDSLLPETEDSDNRSFIAFNKGEQVYYARSPITKEWTVCSASISEIANSVEGASLIGIGDDVNEFIDISSVKAYINTGEEDDEYQLIEKQDLMSDNTFSREEKNKIKSALGIESGIRVSDTQPDGNNEMIDVWINTSEEEETVELVSKSDLQDSNYFTENQKGLVREAIGVVGIEDIAQELGDSENKVVSQKKIKETFFKQKNFFIDDYQTKNMLDESKMKSGYMISIADGTLIDNAAYISTDYVDVEGLEKVALYSCLTDAFTPKNEFFRGALYDATKTFINGLNNHPTEGKPERGIVIIPENAKYIRVCFMLHPNFSKYMMTTGEIVDYEKYRYGAYEIPLPSESWRGKTWLSYGDSITAIGNEIENKDDGSWQMKIRDYFGMKKAYGRGIGGQTFVYNTRPWFANPNGSYNSRDDNGDMTDVNSYTVPEGCTAHYGYFASWDRICTMIPDEIKDTIDLITVFGVNDADNTFVSETWKPPTYHSYKNFPEDWTVRDGAWETAEENNMAGSAGDFNISTIDGAIASTILKLQTRCPNAVIVFGTSWSGRGDNSTSTGNYSAPGIAYYNHALRVKTVANYYSIPVVDIWGTSGVNCFNRSRHNQDSTHPYLSRGKMMLARAWIGGLNGICPILD